MPGVDRPLLARVGSAVKATHPVLGERYLHCDGEPALLFTENETNTQRIFGAPNRTPYVKDGINEFLLHDRREAVNPAQTGTKVAAYYPVAVKAGASATVRLRLLEREVQLPWAHRRRCGRRVVRLEGVGDVEVRRRAYGGCAERLQRDARRVDPA